MRPISLQPGRAGSVPAKTGRETLPMFGSDAPDDCFRFLEAVLPNIALDVKSTASDEWLPSHSALLLEGFGQWHGLPTTFASQNRPPIPWDLTKKW